MEYRTVKNPRSKRLVLRLDASGLPVVTVPSFTPGWLVKKFVNDQAEWITIQQEKFANQKKSLVSSDSLTLFGKKYDLEIKETPGVSKTEIENQKIKVLIHQVPEKTQLSPSADQISRHLERFLKNTATHYLVPRTKALAQKMKISYSKITLRAQKTRWGSCSSQGHLNFNWRLVHFSPEVIDYVIIHELAHRTHLNHSRDFWQLVAKFDPAYRLHQGVLKRQGVGLG